jgi:hypothetical protein
MASRVRRGGGDRRGHRRRVHRCHGDRRRHAGAARVVVGEILEPPIHGARVGLHHGRDRGGQLRPLGVVAAAPGAGQAVLVLVHRPGSVLDQEDVGLAIGAAATTSAEAGRAAATAGTCRPLVAGRGACARGPRRAGTSTSPCGPAAGRGPHPAGRPRPRLARRACAIAAARATPSAGAAGARRAGAAAAPEQNGQHRQTHPPPAPAPSFDHSLNAKYHARNATAWAPRTRLRMEAKRG